MASVEAWAMMVVCTETMGGTSDLWHDGKFKCDQMIFLPWNSNFLSEHLILFIINMESFGIYTAEICSKALIC